MSPYVCRYLDTQFCGPLHQLAVRLEEAGYAHARYDVPPGKADSVFSLIVSFLFVVAFVSGLWHQNMLKVAQTSGQVAFRGLLHSAQEHA